MLINLYHQPVALNRALLNTCDKIVVLRISGIKYVCMLSGYIPLQVEIGFCNYFFKFNFSKNVFFVKKFTQTFDAKISKLLSKVLLLRCVKINKSVGPTLSEKIFSPTLKTVNGKNAFGSRLH